MNKFLASMAGVAVTLAGAHSASAQSTANADESDVKLEEVVVTAERVEKNLQKVSQVINVTSGEQLKKEGKTRIDEILNGIAGVQLQGSQVDSSIYMRGISTGVPVIVDGVQTSGVVLRGNTLDVAQVAVARGVQNGAGVTGLTGSISLVTNKPAFEYQATGSLTLGSYNLRNTEGVLNLPLSDNQAVRLAYSADRRNGYLSNDSGNSDNRQFRLRYRWQVNDDIEVNASYQENRVNGNGVQQGTLLYTGHWIPWSPTQTLNWTNPYTGSTSTWGYGGTAIYNSGFVNAANVISSVSTTSSGQAYNASNQLLYPSGACVTNNAATASATLAGLGPVVASTFWGCPGQYLAIRDGVNFYDRSNPWDDGAQRYGFWANAPVRDTLTRTANVTMDWQTGYGKWTVQPAFSYTLNRFVEPTRGTSYMGEGGIPTKRGTLDVQLASNADSTIRWVAGLNGSYTPRAKDGNGQWTVSYPTNGWTALAAGMSSTAAVGSNCYTVLPNATNPATGVGTANSLPCYSTSWSAGTKSYNYALSLQATYPVLDTLRLNGSVRKDWYASEVRGALGTNFLVDGTGQRYYWYLPATTGVASTTATPNSLFVVPYRMNLSDADLAAVVNSVGVVRKSNTESYTFSTEYDITSDIMAYARYATGTSQAMGAGMGGATGGTLNVALPDARIPGTTTPYTASVNLPSPLVKGEATRQITLGVKSQWLDNTLRVNLEAFNSDYHNRALNQILSGLYSYSSTSTGAETCTASASNPVAVRLSATTGLSCFATNIGSFTGDMLSRGIDLEVTYLPTNSDQLSVQAEYLRMTFKDTPELGTLTAAEVSSYNQSGVANDTDAATFADGWNTFLSGLKGQVLPQAPRWSVTMNYEHRFELPNGARLTPLLTAYYKSAFYFTERTQDGDNSLITNANWAINNGRSLPYVQRGYSLFDLNMSYRPKDSRWTLSGYVKNIENEPVMTSASPAGIISSGSIATNDLSMIPTSGYVSLNAPRTFGLTLQATF